MRNLFSYSFLYSHGHDFNKAIKSRTSTLFPAYKFMSQLQYKNAFIKYISAGKQRTWHTN